MNAPSDDIVTILEGAGLGVAGTSLFSGNLPDTKKVLAIGVIDTGGFDSEYSIDIEKPTVQIKVRGPKFVDVYSKVRAIGVQIMQATDVIIGTTRYIHILQNGQPMNLGIDEDNRYTYALNFRMERTSTI